MGLVLQRERTYSDSVKSLAVLCETYSLNPPFQHFHRLLSLQIIGMNIKSTSPQKDIHLTFWELLLYVRHSQRSAIVSKGSLHRKYSCCPCSFSSYLMEYQPMVIPCQSLRSFMRWEC